MPKFYVKTLVEYFQEVECETEADAEALGWEFDDSNYGGVYDITVEEIEEYDNE